LIKVQFADIGQGKELGFFFGPVICVSWLEGRELLHILIYRSVRAFVPNLKDKRNESSGAAVPDTWSKHVIKLVHKDRLSPPTKPGPCTTKELLPPHICPISRDIQLDVLSLLACHVKSPDIALGVVIFSLQEIG
jgi:hypothetical protein